MEIAIKLRRILAYVGILCGLALLLILFGELPGGDAQAAACEDSAYPVYEEQREREERREQRQEIESKVCTEGLWANEAEEERPRENIRPPMDSEGTFYPAMPPIQPPRRWTYYDVDVISRMVWGEGRGVSRNEQKLIVWTVINRLEDGRYGSTLVRVVRAPGQFHGYRSTHPVTASIRQMAIEVLEAWDRGETAKVYPPFARVSDYRYFWGDGAHNWFRRNWR